MSTNAASMDDWQPISSAPTKGYPIQHVRVKLADGTVHEDAHWASDLSGECQPPFQGWFVPYASGGGFYQIDDPTHWMPRPTAQADI